MPLGHSRPQRKVWGMGPGYLWLKACDAHAPVAAMARAASAPTRAPLIAAVTANTAAPAAAKNAQSWGLISRPEEHRLENYVRSDLEPDGKRRPEKGDADKRLPTPTLVS